MRITLCIMQQLAYLNSTLPPWKTIMLSSVRNFFHRVRGERWEETQMRNGVGCRLVFNRENELKYLVLRHLPTYQRSNFADTRGSLRIGVKNGQWQELLEFARSMGEARQKWSDFDFDRDRNRIFYSLDGEIFSIPCQTMEEIDARLSDRG